MFRTFKPVFSHISLAFNHICHYYFEPPTQSVDPFLPSQTFRPIPVHYWSLTAQREEALPYASGLLVSKVEFCKAVRGLQHEFLIISLYHRSTNRSTCFLVERRQPDKSHVPTEEPESQFAPDDCVFTPAEGFRAGIDVYVQHTYGPYKSISTFTPVENISATQLSVLLEVPGNIEPDRLSYSNDSYWYAESVYDSIKCLSPSGMEEIAKQKSKGCPKNPPEKTQNSTLDIILQRYNSDWSTLKRKYPSAGPGNGKSTQ